MSRGWVGACKRCTHARRLQKASERGDAKKEFGGSASRRGFFFFQAEDGIRDYKVTGVQTCALPISRSCRSPIGSSNEQVPEAARWRRAAPMASPLARRPRQATPSGSSWNAAGSVSDRKSVV